MIDYEALARFLNKKHYLYYFRTNIPFGYFNRNESIKILKQFPISCYCDYRVDYHIQHLGMVLSKIIYHLTVFNVLSYRNTYLSNKRITAETLIKFIQLKSKGQIHLSLKIQNYD